MVVIKPVQGIFITLAKLPANQAVRQWSIYVLFGLALLPALLMLWYLVRFAVNIPYYDEWQMTPLVVKLHTGGFSFNDFWEPHNEHRIVVLRLITLALASLGGWDITREIYFSFFSAGLTALLVWRLLVLTVPKRLVQAGLTALASLLIFATQQVQNWLWGFQFSWFLIDTFAVGAAFALTLWQGKKRGWLVAVSLTILATYSSSMGLAIWPAGLIGLIINRRNWSWPLIVGWVVAMLGAVGLYFYNFALPARDNLIFFHKPLEFTSYVLVYLGNILTTGDDTTPAIIIGAVGVSLWLISSGRLGWQVWTEKTDLSRTLPWFTLTLYAIFNALITALGRIEAGINQARESRYTTVSLIFWLGTAVIVYQAVGTVKLKKLAVQVGLGVLVALALVLYGLAYQDNYKKMAAWHESLANAASFLYDYTTAPDTILTFLSSNAQYVRDMIWTLQQHHEGIFAPASFAKHQAQLAANHELVNNQTSQLFSYPAKTLRLTLGNIKTISIQPEAFNFEIVDGRPLVFDVYPADYNRQGNGHKLVVRNKRGLYVRVSWNTGEGIAKAITALIPPSPDKDSEGLFYYVTDIPENATEVVVTVFYTNSRVVQDTLKVSVFK